MKKFLNWLFDETPMPRWWVLGAIYCAVRLLAIRIKELKASIPSKDERDKKKLERKYASVSIDPEIKEILD